MCFTARMRRLAFCGVYATVVALSSCAHQPKPTTYDVPGFWLGLLHGFLIVFQFIGSLFTDHRIYAFPNSGRWYDFGFVIGAVIFISGANSSQHKSS